MRLTERHSGTSKVIKRVQKIIGVKQDGIVGTVTLSAINKEGDELFEKVQEARKQFLNAIVNIRPSQKKFLKGWMNRVNDLNDI